MAEQKEFVANPHEKVVQLMMVELNWLFKTRKLLGLPNAELTEHYLREIDNYAEGYEQYRQQPLVSRGSKRQVNLKMKKQSFVKKGRESLSVSKKQAKRLSTPKSGSTNHQLANVLLLKQS